MKILVFSDSHGRSANMLKAIAMHPDAELLLHLGDGTDDLRDVTANFPHLQVLHVNGNREDGIFPRKNDPPFSTVTCLGKTVFFCHGHRHNVSYTDQNLVYSAMEKNADIALYGHTHTKDNRYIPPNETPKSKGLYVFNPGSISRPRDGLYPSFGLIELRENGILLSHGIIKPI